MKKPQSYFKNTLKLRLQFAHQPSRFSIVDWAQITWFGEEIQFRRTRSLGLLLSLLP